MDFGSSVPVFYADRIFECIILIGNICSIGKSVSTNGSVRIISTADTGSVRIRPLQCPSAFVIDKGCSVSCRVCNTCNVSCQISLVYGCSQSFLFLIQAVENTSVNSSIFRLEDGSQTAASVIVVPGLIPKGIGNAFQKSSQGILVCGLFSFSVDNGDYISEAIVFVSFTDSVFLFCTDDAAQHIVVKEPLCCFIFCDLCDVFVYIIKEFPGFSIHMRFFFQKAAWIVFSLFHNSLGIFDLFQISKAVIAEFFFISVSVPEGSHISGKVIGIFFCCSIGIPDFCHISKGIVGSLYFHIRWIFDIVRAVQGIVAQCVNAAFRVNSLYEVSTAVIA